MKALLLTIITALGLTGCASNTNPKNVTLRSTECNWYEVDPTQSLPEPCKVNHYTVKHGKSFGMETTYFEGKPFTVEGINEDGSVLVSPHGNLVVAGSSIKSPPLENPIKVSSRSVCFRTRTVDAGADICLKVASENLVDQNNTPKPVIAPVKDQPRNVIVPSGEPIQYIGE